MRSESRPPYNHQQAGIARSRRQIMPAFHFEEYVYLAGLTHKTVLIAWGGFFFRVKDNGTEFKLVDDDDLENVFPPRDETIGESARPYGVAEVKVFDALTGTLAGIGVTATANHVEIADLQSDREYTYEVLVGGKPWGRGDLLDWNFDEGGNPGLRKSGRRYENRFRTFPHVTEPANVTFAVIGDFGTGVRKPSKENSRQREIADALEHAVEHEAVRFVLTTGDNIYAQKKFAGLAIGGQGDEDDDWFFTFFQPYRYVINRVPMFPTVGNHDSGESEFENDDRKQVYDNFYINERFRAEQLAGRASLGPGLFYRLRYGLDVEFIALDSSKASIVAGHRFFMEAEHRAFLEEAFRPMDEDQPRWRIPFFHHPPYTAGPNHNNSDSVIKHLVKKHFHPAGVRIAFCGHEHNYQHAIADDVHYLVTGGAGKVAAAKPKRDRFSLAHTKAWAGTAHFLLGRIEGNQLSIRPIGERIGGALVDIGLEDADGNPVATPILISI
jgi:tartrate-resistant acid phosphatase type 5